MPALLRKIAAVLVISLILGACNGDGDSGSTWFNLPSVPIRVDANGDGTALGFPMGAILQQPMLDQFAVAGVDVLEVRIGYHGVFLYADGEPLPYLKWSDESTGLLSEILPYVPGAGQAVPALTWLRRVGVGAIIVLPTAGADVPRWQGEELVRRRTASETTIGPLQFASLAFDENGKASFEGTPMANIEQALGASLGLDLPPMALQIIKGLGVEQFSIATQPNGIELALDSTALPGLAYDIRRLNNLLPILSAFVDPSMGGMIAEVVPKLPGADLDIIISFTGELAADTQLPTIPVNVGEDGSVSAFGVPVGTGSLLPASLLGILSDSNILKLDLSIKNEGLYLALNEEPLPAILWNDASLGTIGQIAVDLLGVSPGLVDAGLPVLRALLAKTAISLSLGLPGQDGMTFADDYDVTVPAFAAAPEAGELGQIGASIDKDGFVVSALGVSLVDMAFLLQPIRLPQLVLDILRGPGSDTLQLKTSASTTELVGDSGTLLTLQYDEAALNRLVVVVSSLSDRVPFIQTIIDIPILPNLAQILGAGLNVQLALAGQEAPETSLASMPVEVKADGALAVLGIPLGSRLTLPPTIISDMQELNIQRLDLNIIDASLYLASNGENLPVISWTEGTMETLQRVADELPRLPPGTFGAVVGFLQNTDIGVALSIPPADGAEAVSVPPAFDVTAVRMEPPAIEGEHRPVLALGLTLDGTEIRSIGGLSAAELEELGVSLPSLPANIAFILYDGLQVSELELISTANQLNVVADDAVLLTLRYDSPSIVRTLELAAPFLPEQIGAALDDPNISALLIDEFLPLIVGANLDVTAELVQE